jgi:phosphorylase/glycogen(starch) synthase
VNASKPGFLYSISWEVCNRVGGVHTVLETAAPHLAQGYGDNMLFVGPDLWADRSAQVRFIEDRSETRVAAVAEEHDVPARFGRWDIEGRPRVALVDFGRLLEHKNAILGDLWDHFGVDSIHADWDPIERLLFGSAAGRLIELHYRLSVRPRGLRAVAHFHQWQAAAGILRLAATTPEVGTVFTPHGTALGRKLASSGVRIDRTLVEIDPEEAAAEENLVTPHSLECAAAETASILTTVSEHSAEEAAHILGRVPDLVTPNGYPGGTPVDPARRATVRNDLLLRAGKFLGTKLDPATTRIAMTAARYEYHNKGISLILEALGRLEAQEKKLLLLVAVSATQTGPRPVVLKRLTTDGFAGEPCGICTHNLAHPENDPILAGCREHGLDNAPDSAAFVLFVPVQLDGLDAVVPYSYDDVLRACDVSVFPSIYEPWGYTPVESLAAGVPTVTTDLTGFGRYLLERAEEQHPGVLVLPLASASAREVDSIFDRAIRRFLENGQSAPQSKAVLDRVSWERLIGDTFDAHERALEKAGDASAALGQPSLAGSSRRPVVPIPERSGSGPRLHPFRVAAALPADLARLPDIACNLWWSWTPRARALFARIDEGALAKVEGNPVQFLAELPPAKLAAAAADPTFVAECTEVAAEFDAYLARDGADAPRTTYFCAEFALHESLPIYSGGLGVLAGDHLKSASDIRIPLSAVGLRYADGYFQQRIDRDGHQIADPQTRDPRMLPMTEVLDKNDRPLRIRIEMPEHDLYAGAWRVDVGRVPLYLLDTDVSENDLGNRGLTSKLYPSDREWRLRQEILLGIGGWRLLRALEKTPEVCHLNEGHSAFLLMERARELVENSGLTFAEACVAVRGSSLFTTHTPVPAGHDRFHEELMRRYFAGPAARLGLDWEEFFDLGRTSHEDKEFSMTTLALRLTGRANGVSALHGEVSRDMLADTWPGLPATEAPVKSVTNGVHLPTWCGPELRPLLDAVLGPVWREEKTGTKEWARLGDLPDVEIWRMHAIQKHRMIARIRDSIEQTSVRRGVASSVVRKRLTGLREDALVIGYARRFAPYKRATLLFRDMERLRAILDNEARPVRVVYAGKAHPDDAKGGELIREVVALSEDPRLEGRVFFVEDYDMEVARHLVQGVDVWLNTPTRPLEASGTSGMKAALNGAPHFSILDGWWCEGYDGTNGWAIGDETELDNPELQAEADSRSLYRLLESDLVPSFFDRDGDGIPHTWVERMRRSMCTVPAFFSTNRMVSDYVDFGYQPLGETNAKLSANQYREARKVAARREKLRAAWDGVSLEDVSVTDVGKGAIGLGEAFEVKASLRAGEVSPDDLVVELFIETENADQESGAPTVIALARKGEVKDGLLQFAGAYMPNEAGSFLYGVRVRPNDRFETEPPELIVWS